MPDEPALLAGLAAGHCEGQGVWLNTLHEVSQIPRIDAAARAGDAAAAANIRSFADYFSSIWALVPTGLQQCLACETVFTMTHLPVLLSTLRPHVAQPQHTLIGGICRQCAARSDLSAAIQERYRAVFGTVRQIEIGAAGAFDSGISSRDLLTVVA